MLYARIVDRLVLLFLLLLGLLVLTDLKYLFDEFSDVFPVVLLAFRLNALGALKIESAGTV